MPEMPIAKGELLAPLSAQERTQLIGLLTRILEHHTALARTDPPLTS
jgi:hypothetical protein